jgi:hypothetical protein
LDEQAGASESHVLRQEGRTSGQGAFDGIDAADETGAGRTEVGTVGDVISVAVVTGAGTNVVGGASVHLVQTVTVEVTTVSVRVNEVVIMVIESEMPVMVTGHKVVVVKIISDVTTSDGVGTDAELSTVTAKLAEDGEISVIASETEDDGARVEPGRTKVEVDSAGTSLVSVAGWDVSGPGIEVSGTGIELSGTGADVSEGDDASDVTGQIVT